MLKLQLLFSGGKDSCLAAIMLQKFFEIELLTYNFAVLSNWKKAETVANMLKIRFRVVKLDKEILEKAGIKIEILANKTSFALNLSKRASTIVFIPDECFMKGEKSE